MYSLHLLYNPHQAFQGVKSSGLYNEKYGRPINPYPAHHDYCRFQPVLFVDKMTVIENEMFV